MKFEENSNCSFEEKISMVSNEIIEAYPEISLKDAEEIAMLDETINKPANNDIKFMRYYYILLITHENLTLRKKILKEITELAKKGFDDDKLYELFNEIYNFVSGKRIDFPLVSELYGY